MKILMIHPHDIYSVKEPWTVRITAIAEELVKHGHEVKLVYFPLPAGERGLVNENKYPFQVIAFNRRKWAIFRNIHEMIKLARWADIVHFQKCFSIASLPALFAAYLTGKPLHYDWDDWEYQIYLFSPPSHIYGKYLNYMERSVPKLADTVSVASEAIKQMALSLGISEDRIVDAHVGADLTSFSSKNSGDAIRKKYKIKKGVPVVAYLGQLHGAQYAELFIKSAGELIKKKAKAKFMVIGWGVEANKLITLAQQLGISDKIIFTNYITHDDVPKYLAVVDIAVACFEDNKITRCKSPLKIVEYLAAGKAIVASDVGEVRRMIGNTGIIVEPGSPSALSAGIMRFLKNKKLRAEAGKKARARAEKEYNWKVTTENILSAYDTAIKINTGKYQRK